MVNLDKHWSYSTTLYFVVMFSPESFIIRRQCTPFCEAKCKYAGHHHKILVAVINCVDNRSYNEFTKTITKFVRKGWKVDDPIEDPYPEFRYPLVHWATVLGNVMVLKWCVDQGLNLNKRWGQRSETALHRLMVCGYSALRENSHNILKTFKRLVKLLKVLLQSKDDNKDLPIHVAAKVLVERPLMGDSRFDPTYTEMLKILVRITCELDPELLNCRNRDGNTVMHILSQHDKGAEILKLLIENGADCDLPNAEGIKPIDIAKAKDVTDIIGVLSKNDEDHNSSCSKNEDDHNSSCSKNEDDTGLEEIGDIDIIYIESDDDMDNNNDEKDETYIRNLLERVKSEPDDEMDETNEDTNDAEDKKDPDWNDTDLEASTSNDTLFTIDEDSYDIDGPFASLNDSAFDGNLGEQRCISRNDKQTSTLKRKSSDKETVQGPEEKKLKNPNAQGKERKVISPKLEIQLNMPKFKSLKRKIRQETMLGEKAAKTVFPVCSSPDLTTQTQEIAQTRTVSPSNEEFAQQAPESSQNLLEKEETGADTAVAVVTVSEQSNEQNESVLSSSKFAGTLPGMCTEEIEQVQGQLINYLSSVKESLPTTKPAENLFPSSEVASEEIPQPRTLSSSREESIPQTTEDAQRSFSSSAEIRSAWQRLHGKIAGHGSLKDNLSQLGKLFDILKPAETRTKSPVGTSTPSPVTIESDRSSSGSSTEQESSIPGGLSMEQQLSSSSLLTMDQQRSSPGLVLSEQHYSNQSTPSPPTDHPRSKKRIEDVITNLKERHSRRESFESSSSTESNSIQDQLNGKQSDSITEQQATTDTSLRIQTAKKYLTNGEGSDDALERQVAVELHASRSSTPLTNNDQANDQSVLPLSENDLSKTTKISQVQNSDIVIKKETNDSERSGKFVDGNVTNGETPTTSRSSVTSQGGINQKAVSDHDSNTVTKKSSKRPRIPRNALPTQVQAGSYRAMIPGGFSTSTFETPADDGASTSTDTSDSGAGRSDGTYQQLSSLTSEAERLCEEINNASSSPHTVVSSGGKTDSNYDPLYSVIDEFCEEVYGISRGPERRRKKQGETSKRAEDSVQNNATQPQSLAQSEVAPTPGQVEDQGSLPTQTQSTTQKQPEVEIKIKQEPGVEDSYTQSQTMAHDQTLENPADQTRVSVPGQIQQAAGQMQTNTTQGQVVSTQIQPTLPLATQPTENIAQGQTQVPRNVLLQQQHPLQTVGQNTVQTLEHVPAQSQTQPVGFATQGPGYIPTPQNTGQIRLQHMIPGPFQEMVHVQGQGRGRIQVPRQILAQVLHKHFPGMVHLLSPNGTRRPANPQNVGMNQQNVTRPVNPQNVRMNQQNVPRPVNPQNIGMNQQNVTRPVNPQNIGMNQQNVTRPVNPQNIGMNQQNVTRPVNPQNIGINQQNVTRPVNPQNIGINQQNVTRPVNPQNIGINQQNVTRLVNPQNIGINQQNVTRPVNPQHVGMNQQNVTRPVNPQNIGMNQQNVTRPTTMMRPQNIRQVLRQSVTQNVNNPPAVYSTQSNQVYAPNPTTPAFVVVPSTNPQPRQPTLHQINRYYQTRTNVPNGHTNILGQPIPGSIQLQRPNAANLSGQRAQGPNQVLSLRPRYANIQPQPQNTTQIRPPNPNISSHVQTYNGRTVIARVLGPDTETAMANKINRDPTDRSTLNSAMPASVVSSAIARSNVSSSLANASGVNNSPSEREGK